jgi:hypothetical protein
VRVQDGEFVYRGEACQDFGSGAGRMVFTTVKLMELEGFVLDEHFLAVFADDGVVAEEQRAKRTVLLEGFFEVRLVALLASPLLTHIGVGAQLGDGI